jgi:hypothetical protein
VFEPADRHSTMTFAVRLWREADASGHRHWRRRVEYVALQEVGYVEDVVAAVRFMERWTGEPDAAPTAHLADASCAGRE